MRARTQSEATFPIKIDFGRAGNEIGVMGDTGSFVIKQGDQVLLGMQGLFVSGEFEGKNPNNFSIIVEGQEYPAGNKMYYLALN